MDKFITKSLQNISNNKGKTTGVFFPLQQWGKLKTEYMLPNEIESLNHFQKDELDDRIDHYIENPQEVYSWEDVKKRLLVSKI